MELVELFKKIVTIDSVSGEEGNIADYLESELIDLGLEVTRDKFNNIYTSYGTEGQPKLFCAHMDTVEPGRGIEVIEEDGYLKSKGNTILGGDNKVSLSTILNSAKQHIQSGNKRRFELLFTVREETNSGISDFDSTILESKYGFVFDGGGEDLGWMVSAAPFINDFEVEIIGKSTHGAYPESGDNALVKAVAFMNELTIGRVDESSTLNIGIVQGGSATNTIPGEVVLKGDLRSYRSENFYRHIKTFENLLEKHCNNYKLSWIPYSTGFEIDISESYIDKVIGIYKSFGVEINPKKTTGGSDANCLNNAGIKTLCLGDGVIGAHTVDERVSIENLNRLSAIVSELMVNEIL